jgi:hypothetical protein
MTSMGLARARLDINDGLRWPNRHGLLARGWHERGLVDKPSRTIGLRSPINAGLLGSR